LLDNSLWLGVLYLCTLPSTVQSSIAFTSIAKGNVAAAICAATASNLLGIVLTPLLVAALLNLRGDTSPLEQIGSIVLQLLVPFVLGQIASRWLRPWAMRHASLLTISDRGSMVLVVYSAFSAAVHAGAWTGLSWLDIAKVIAICVLLLATGLLFTRSVSRAAKLAREDEIAVVFCGSKKSLATGLPMANVLFPAATVGLIILPVMVFHQIQLMVCAALARRYAQNATAPLTETGPPAT
jgi:sodium/bile acid cotransporter 7